MAGVSNATRPSCLYQFKLSRSTPMLLFIFLCLTLAILINTSAETGCRLIFSLFGIAGLGVLIFLSQIIVK